MRRRHRTAGAILVTALLCSAFAARECAAAPTDDIIARGKALTIASDCASCHTADPAKPFAGGKRIDTPFGAVFSPNLTPDHDTGIGGWSEDDFLRALRMGISPSGAHYYPAFPYPSFTKLIRDDILAIRAYLATLPPVSNRPPPPQLRWPLNYRVLMRAWNALFFTPGIIQPDQSKGADWNRGRYLVEALGHCGACHTPRNALGAEKGGSAYLAGGEAEGWEAPALTRLSAGPIPWSEAQLYTYLKTGTSQHHGAAAGPMAPVIAELKELPDADIRAMATYLASLSEPLPETEATERVKRIEAMTASAANPAASPIARLYEGACAACHETGRAAPLLNAGPMLGLSSKLHAATPTNLVNMLLEGGQHGIGSMPSFATALDDRQLADLAAYLRGRFAPEKSAWSGIEDAIAKARKAAH